MDFEKLFNFIVSILKYGSNIFVALITFKIIRVIHLCVIVRRVYIKVNDFNLYSNQLITFNFSKTLIYKDVIVGGPISSNIVAVEYYSLTVPGAINRFFFFWKIETDVSFPVSVTYKK